MVSPNDMSFRASECESRNLLKLQFFPCVGYCCSLSGFLHFACVRNDMSVGGSVRPHRFYSLRCMAMNHRRYIAWYHSTAQVVFETWRAANCRPYLRNTIQPHGLYWGRPPGTAHRPFPTVSLIGVLIHKRISKTDTFVTPIIVNFSLISPKRKKSPGVP